MEWVTFQKLSHFLEYTVFLVTELLTDNSQLFSCAWTPAGILANLYKLFKGMFICHSLLPPFYICEQTSYKKYFTSAGT